MPDTNPLLADLPRPAFSAILPEHVVPALDQLLGECRAVLERCTAGEGPVRFEDLVLPMEEAEDRLHRTWSPVVHLHSVKDAPALREAYNACLPKLSAYDTEVGQHERLFRAYGALREGAGYARLDPTARRIVDNALRDFRLAGVHLPKAQKERYRDIAARLSTLAARYEENVLDATQGWSRQVQDASLLRGLPESTLALAREKASAKGLEGWSFGLDFPSYYPVMLYAESRALREELYTAHATRASDRGPLAGRYDNGPLMEEILALRHERAQLLGYPSYAHLSLERKMARSPEEVTGFLRDLAARARPAARREFAELGAFAREESGLEALEAWDVAYYAEKLRQRRFTFSQEEIKPWFPAPRVIEGMFRIVERLYGIGVREVAEVDTWHPDVRYFELHAGDGTVLGNFYLDLYAREGKRSGAWMDECVVRRRTTHGVQLPAAYLTCNFTPPLGESPSLLTHDDVLTLFHEFGHGLHHLLTRVERAALSGINGVAWDAVELPSQFMEHWCWEPEALRLISGHYRTGEPLSDQQIERLRATRDFHAGMQMVRQLEFALFDFELHHGYDPARGARIGELLDQIRAEVSVAPVPAWNRFAHSFSHIFAGGYGAGYYSYKWAEVLACDAFSLFEERGIFDRTTGQAFRRAVLEPGGTREALDLFVDFRGRAPDSAALLRHSGLATGERAGGR